MPKFKSVFAPLINELEDQVLVFFDTTSNNEEVGTYSAALSSAFENEFNDLDNEVKARLIMLMVQEFFAILENELVDLGLCEQDIEIYFPSIRKMLKHEGFYSTLVSFILDKRFLNKNNYFNNLWGDISAEQQLPHGFNWLRVYQTTIRQVKLLRFTVDEISDQKNDYYIAGQRLLGPESKQYFIEEIDKGTYIYIHELVSYWPDDQTYNLLKQWAARPYKRLWDDVVYLKSKSIEGLAAYWPDKKMYDLLCEIIKNESSGIIKISCFHSLGLYWPTSDVKKLMLADVKKGSNSKEPDYEYIAELLSLLGWFFGKDIELYNVFWKIAKVDYSNYRASEKAYNGFSKKEALSYLAKYWKAKEVLQLLKHKIIQDEDYRVREHCLELLLLHWHCEETREFLNAIAVDYPTITILDALVKHWPDLKTKALLFQRLEQENNVAIIQWIVNHWFEKDLRHLVCDHILKSNCDYFIMMALELLVSHWTDSQTEFFIKDNIIAQPAISTKVKKTALELLVKYYQSDALQDYLVSCVANEQDSELEFFILDILSQNWSNDAVSALIKLRVEKNITLEEKVKKLSLLLKYGCNESVRNILLTYLKDDDNNVGKLILELLVEYWPDNKTRELLELIIKNYNSTFMKSYAVYFLAEQWPDEKAYELLCCELRTSSVKNRIAYHLLQAWGESEQLIRLFISEAEHNDDCDFRIALINDYFSQWRDKSIITNLIQKLVIDDKETKLRITCIHWLDRYYWSDSTLMVLKQIKDDTECDIEIRQHVWSCLIDHYSDEEAEQFLYELWQANFLESSRVYILERLRLYHKNNRIHKFVMYAFKSDERILIKEAALRKLGEYCQYKKTYKILKDILIKNDNVNLCAQAVALLVEHWQDKHTYQFLIHLLSQDSVIVRTNILMHLCEYRKYHKDNHLILLYYAEYDSNEEVRERALWELITNFKEEKSTQELLERFICSATCTCEEKKFAIRNLLAVNDYLRPVLMSLLDSCENINFLHTTVLGALAKYWPDEETYQLIHSGLFKKESDIEYDDMQIDYHVFCILLKEFSERVDLRDFFTNLLLNSDIDEVSKSLILTDTVDRWPDVESYQLLLAMIVAAKNNDELWLHEVALKALDKYWSDGNSNEFPSDYSA